jgi:antitoxin ParD1/3/4
MLSSSASSRQVNTRTGGEAIRDALRVLQQKRREDALKLRALRAQIKAGLDELERGDFSEIAEADLAEYS